MLLTRHVIAKTGSFKRALTLFVHNVILNVRYVQDQTIVTVKDVLLD